MSRYLVPQSDALQWHFPLHATALRHVLRHAQPTQQPSLAAALLVVDPTRTTAATSVLNACSDVSHADAAATVAPEDGGRIAPSAVFSAATRPQLHFLSNWALRVGVEEVTMLHTTPHDPLSLLSDLRRLKPARNSLHTVTGPLSSAVARLVRCCSCFSTLRRHPTCVARLRETLSDATHLRMIELDHSTVCDDTVAAIVDAVGTRLQHLRLPHAPQLTDAAFDTIGAGTSLVSLVIRDTRVTDQGLEHLSMSGGIPTQLVKSLETLDLGHVGSRVTMNGTGALQQLRQLKELRVRLRHGVSETSSLPPSEPLSLPPAAVGGAIEMTPVESTTSGLNSPIALNDDPPSTAWSFASLTPSALLLTEHDRQTCHRTPAASACVGIFGADSPALACVDFSGSGDSVGAATMRALTCHLHSHPSMRELRVGNTIVDDSMVISLADAGSARTLHTLDLSRTKLTDVGLAHFLTTCGKDLPLFVCPLETLILKELVISSTGLAKIGNAAGLKQLILDGCPLVGDAALDCLCHCTALTSLSLLSCGSGSRHAQGGEEFTGAGFSNLARSCTRLRSINVADTGINDMMISHLAALPELRALSLAHNLTINGACFITFAAHESLVSVDLAGCEYFDGVGIHHLSNVGGLQHLDLVAAKLITDDCLELLLQGNPLLERLRFTLYPGITDAALRTLMAHGPALRQVEMYAAPNEDNGSLMAQMMMTPDLRLDKNLVTLLRRTGVRVFYDNSWSE